MPIRSCFAVPTVLAAFWLFSDRAIAQSHVNNTPGPIEQSMAGLKIGDRVRTARQVFPGLKMTGGVGVWTVRLGRNCKLEVVSADQKGRDPRIEVITIERIDREDAGTDQECDSAKTGAGLSMGASISEVHRIYKQIPLAEPGKEPSLYRKDNGPDCLAGRSPELKSIFVYWSNRTNRIQMFSVDASRLSCEEYRSTERTGK